MAKTRRNRRRTIDPLLLTAALLATAWLPIASCTGATSIGADPVTRELALARRAAQRGNQKVAYRHLVLAMRPIAGSPPTQRLEVAEMLLELRDYRRAGNLVLGLFREGSLAPLEGWRPGPEERTRALSLLGKALFFLSRAPLDLSEPPEETAERRRSLEWAEAAFRNVAEGGGPQSDEALYYLAQVLNTQGRDEEAAAPLERFLQRVPPEERHGEMALAEDCWEWWKRWQARRSDDDDEAGALPFAAGEPLTPPSKAHAPSLRYTPPALAARIEGIVILQAIIEPSGRPVCIRPLKALPQGLTEAAIEEVSTWRFQPATREGEPVPAFYSLMVNFRLKK